MIYKVKYLIDLRLKLPTYNVKYFSISFNSDCICGVLITNNTIKYHYSLKNTRR